MIGEEQDSLERKVAIVHFEQVFKGRTHEIDDEDVVVALLSRPHYPRHPRATHECLVYLGLLLEWARHVARDRRFDLDSDFLAGDGVDTQKDAPW